MVKTNFENAAEEVKLAVDLIFLLESNNIEIETALKALEIVTKDFQTKLMKNQQSLKNE